MRILEYKNADRSDIDAIYQMVEILVRKYEDPTVTDITHALKWCRTKIEGNYEAYTCIYADGVKAGYYHLTEHLDLRTELDDLFVLPAFRKQGIGTEVLTKILKETDEPVYLYVFQENVGAVSLYTKLGFNVTKIVSPTRMIMEYRK